MGTGNREAELMERKTKRETGRVGGVNRLILNHNGGSTNHGDGGEGPRLDEPEV